jgi:hypothetical protein
MATARQVLGLFGEQRVVQDCACPRCKRAKTLVRLPPNFKCADVICDFCGYLAQVKTTTANDVNVVPRTLLGAAWGPQKARMDAVWPAWPASYEQFIGTSEAATYLKP